MAPKSKGWKAALRRSCLTSMTLRDDAALRLRVLGAVAIAYLAGFLPLIARLWRHFSNQGPIV